MNGPVLRCLCHCHQPLLPPTATYRHSAHKGGSPSLSQFVPIPITIPVAITIAIVTRRYLYKGAPDNYLRHCGFPKIWSIERMKPNNINTR